MFSNVAQAAPQLVEAVDQGTGEFLHSVYGENLRSLKAHELNSTEVDQGFYYNCRF